MISLSRARAHEKLAALLKKQQEQEDERATLSKKLEDLKLTIQELDSNITATKLAYTRTYNEELSSILNLPAEVTHIIFDYASRAEPMAEISISQVCHTWRSLAFAFPDLWSRVAVIFSDRTQMLETSHYRRLLAYLHRSQNWPLHLRFEIQPLGWSNKLKPMLSRFLKVVIEHAFRWRRVSLQMIPARSPFGAEWDNRDLLAMLEQVSIPKLEFFEVVLPSSPHLVPVRNNGNFQFLFNIGVVPKLAQVRMDSLSFMRCTPPLGNITTLQLENRVELRAQISFQRFLDLLNATSSSLVNLLIGGGVFDTIYERPASLHRVSTMKLKNFFCADQNIAEKLWLLVDAPCLELLIFRGIWFDPFVHFSDSTSDGQTSMNGFPSLKTLALVDCLFDSPLDENFPLARATRGVIHLHIYGGTLPVSRERFLIPSLAQHNSTAPFWPDLQTFACSLSESGEPTAEDYQAYLQQVQSRSKVLQAPSRLQLCRTDAERWAAAHPESWDALVSGGHFEELSVDPRRSRGDALECSPWPLPSFRELWDYP